MKKCSKCSKEKNPQDFHKSPNSHDGLHTICKECRRIHCRTYPTAMREKIVQKLGGVCESANCLWAGGCRDSRCLQIDHKNGGGRKEMIRLGQHGYYKRLIRMSLPKLKQNYQLLCANCNWIKRAVNDENRQSNWKPCKEETPPARKQWFNFSVSVADLS